MSQLESRSVLSWNRNTDRGKVLVILSFLASALLAAGALILTSGDGAHAARELVTRFSSLLFVCSLLAPPLARLVRARPLSALALMSGTLRLSFVATFVFSLACTLMPAAVGGEALPVSAVLYVGLNGLMLLVMLFPANRFATRRMGAASWRAIQHLATAYFWLAFLVSSLVHVARQDDSLVWYGFMLTLLVVALGAIVVAKFSREAVEG